MRKNKRIALSVILCMTLSTSVFTLISIENSYGTDDFATIVALDQITTHSAVDVDASWSPDGSKLVFESERGGSRDIWVMNSDGSNPQQLTSWPERERFPKYSPDSSKIAFMRGYLPHYDIWVMNADGSNPVQLTTHNADDRVPSWTPDGSEIVFESHRSGNGDIWIMNPDGSNKVRLTTHSARDAHPEVSPDGSKIIFTSERSGNSEIWVTNIDGSNQIQLTFDASPSEYNVCPSWSNDGNMIVYSRGYGYDTDIWVMKLDGTIKQQLTFEPGDDRLPDWSPVEDKIVFRSMRSGNYDVWVMTLSFSITPTIDIDPDTLNLKSRGNWVTCYIELPEGYDVNSIDTSTVKISDINGNPVDIPAEAHPTEIDDYDNDSIPDLMVKFDRSEVEDNTSPGNATISVRGEFIDGTEFEESDTIRVIEPP